MRNSKEFLLDAQFNKLKEKISCYFTDSGHQLDHTERVYNLAVRIAKSEQVNLLVIQLSALLHDIARFKEVKGSNICHAEEGSIMAREILSGEGYGDDLINHVCDCISTHRYSKKIAPNSIEARILQDADRLDALGAICIGRVFSFNGAKGVPMFSLDIPPAKNYPSKDSGKTALNHFKEKIFKLTPDSFYTDLAKKIAIERYNYVMDFVKRFEKEWVGKL